MLRRLLIGYRSRVAIRKQYHFWPGPHGGLDAWDVERLMALSADFPVSEVPVDSIREIDSVYWFDETNVPTVRAVVEHIGLIKAVDTSYPIILGFDGRVMDGMHRVARALLEGRATVPAVRFVSPVEPDHVNCTPGRLPYD